jgi:LmbE family N-acetylglucosaminyl deacetylase
MKILEGNVSIIAAHPDDEVIGMGGTLKRLIDDGNSVSVLFLSDGVGARDSIRETVESRKISAIKSLESLGCTDIEFLDFPDNMLDTVPMLDLCKKIELHLGSRNTEIVFTHYPHDLNIDHRLTCEATTVACRPIPKVSIKQMLYFEVASSTNWKFGDRNFNPNIFVDITDEFDAKSLALNHYSIELNEFPNFRSLDALTSLATMRGTTVGFEKAEAFELGYLRIK